MKNLEVIISLAGTMIGLSITALTFLMKYIKNKKAKRIAEQLVMIGDAVLPLIREAEKFTGYTGAEKKTYVMTKANQYAINQKINFDEKQVGEKVEELVELTNQVNVKNKTEQKVESSTKFWL